VTGADLAKAISDITVPNSCVSSFGIFWFFYFRIKKKWNYIYLKKNEITLNYILNYKITFLIRAFGILLFKK
jgi:hypothetical protein